jgi:hypothetical protein
MHASTSTAARTTAAIAAVESVSECVERACVDARAFDVDWKGEVAVAGEVAAGVVAAVEGAEAAGVVVAMVGVVAAGGVAAAGVVAAGGAVAVDVVIACTLAEAGTGKVGVELVEAAICR